MLGQHPQLYGLPETHLFSFETVGAREEYATRATYPIGHGLLRAIAQLYFGSQTPDAIQEAQHWLTARSSMRTDFLCKVLAERVFPRALVEKSPSSVYSAGVLERIRNCFSRARFIHLIRHPRGFCNSVMKYVEERGKHGPIPPSHWLLEISSYPAPNPPHDQESKPSALDPQNGWYALHTTIMKFLDTVRADQVLRLRGEDLLGQPDRVLEHIVAWLGIRADGEAIDEMKHPERSPYAFLGPPGARYGNDAFFLQDPVLRPSRAEPLSLEGPLEWLNDEAEFSTEVKVLAGQFGYE
jgi:hypothetical protein